MQANNEIFWTEKKVPSFDTGHLVAISRTTFFSIKRAPNSNVTHCAMGSDLKEACWVWRTRQRVTELECWWHLGQHWWWMKLFLPLQLCTRPLQQTALLKTVTKQIKLLVMWSHFIVVNESATACAYEGMLHEITQVAEARLLTFLWIDIKLDPNNPFVISFIHTNWNPY